jgi:hypothetical protein
MKLGAIAGVLGAACGALIGCEHATMIHSVPSGASVYYQGRVIGITPTRFGVARSDNADTFPLTLEREGYRTEEVTISKQVAPARIVGGIFSLGILWLFKSPSTLPDPVNVTLYPVEVAAHPAPSAAVAPPQSNPSSDDASVDARLRKVQGLFDRGVITEQEYRRYRAAILDDL